LSAMLLSSSPVPFVARRGSDQYFLVPRNRVYSNLRHGTYNLLYRKDIYQEERLPRMYTHNSNIATESYFTSGYILTFLHNLMYISGIESLVKH